jgi:hypothetical protein
LTEAAVAVLACRAWTTEFSQRRESASRPLAVEGARDRISCRPSELEAEPTTADVPRAAAITALQQA